MVFHPNQTEVTVAIHLKLEKTSDDASLTASQQASTRPSPQNHAFEKLAHIEFSRRSSHQPHPSANLLNISFNVSMTSDSSLLSISDYTVTRSVVTTEASTIDPSSILGVQSVQIASLALSPRFLNETNYLGNSADLRRKKDLVSPILEQLFPVNESSSVNASIVDSLFNFVENDVIRVNNNNINNDANPQKTPIANRTVDLLQLVRTLHDDYVQGFITEKGFAVKLASLLESTDAMERVLTVGLLGKPRPAPSLSNVSASSSFSSVSSSSSSDSSFSTGRRLLDAYADSLKHTNKILNRAYGVVARKGALGL